MKKFIDKDFLLDTKTARWLYHEVASAQPILDYHCHLNPKEISENKRFDNIADIWLGGDHYKWRAMRINGISEEYITGDAEPYDKFIAWAKTVPKTMGNPLYHWTHLELQRYFNIHEPLTEDSAPYIWQEANRLLKSDSSLSVYGIFNRFNVYAVGTTDDPLDDLEFHVKIKNNNSTKTIVFPSFRPDKIIDIDSLYFTEYIKKLEKTVGSQISGLEDLLNALVDRIDFFNLLGCRISDHALEYPPFCIIGEKDSVSEIENAAKLIFKKRINGEPLSDRETEAYKTFILLFLAGEYKKRGWAMQLHLAAIRNNNSIMYNRLGPDSGYDAVCDFNIAKKLASLLDLMEKNGSLPKTILYSLNPKDYYPIATIMGCFQGDGIPGKIQLGSAWWFCDHKDGMQEQMKVLASLGLLSRFIGMLTDSRSFLSFPRHEYFRRILCNIIGNWVENGEFPNDRHRLAEIVSDISFYNAKRYFDI